MWLSGLGMWHKFLLWECDSVPGLGMWPKFLVWECGFLVWECDPNSWSGNVALFPWFGNVTQILGLGMWLNFPGLECDPNFWSGNVSHFSGLGMWTVFTASFHCTSNWCQYSFTITNVCITTIHHPAHVSYREEKWMIRSNINFCAKNRSMTELG